MKKCIKKSVLSAFAFAALLCLLALSVSAYGGTEYGNTGIYYEIYNDEVSISGADGDIKTANIPKSIDGYPVTSIGISAFVGHSSLSSVTIPDSVTSIGGEAFSYCTGLKSITIPDSVTSIGASAFSACIRMTGVTIGNGVTKIGEAAFCGCIELTRATIGNSVTSIGTDAFIGCSKLTKITIPNSVTRIGRNAFSGCPFTEIKIGNGLESIGDNAFGGIKAIPEIYYAGSEEEWENISIDSSNDFLLSANMHYNADISHKHSYTEIVTKKATCTADGVKTFTCDCGDSYTKSVPALGHKEKTTTTKATVSNDGKIVTACTVCGKVSKTTVISKASSVTLSKTSFVYNGKTQNPKVTVKDSKGKVLTEGKDYTVTYLSKGANVGIYSVDVALKGNYTGTKRLSFRIVPKGTELKSLSSKVCGFTAKWNKQTSQTTGYQIQYSTKSSFKSAKTLTIKKNSTRSQSVDKLVGNKKYYVRIRTYKSVGRDVCYSSWSATKTVTTKQANSIKISSSLTLGVGGSKKLSVKTYPAKVKVNWKSSDSSIASVSSNGTVKALKKGKATITASFVYGGKTYSAKCVVRVKNPSLSLNKTSVSVTQKSSVILTATTFPLNVKVTWKSSNKSVAKVSSNGKVTGVKPGSATVTASFNYGGKTYKKTCAVTVKKETAKSRYNKIVNYIRKNGDIENVVTVEGAQFYLNISEKDGVLYFYVLSTVDNSTYTSSLVEYRYGDTYAAEAGSLYFGEDNEICKYSTKIPVKDFNQYYYPIYHMEYLSMYEEITDSLVELQDSALKCGFIVWNAQLRGIFGFGMKDIGFSSWEV